MFRQSSQIRNVFFTKGKPSLIKATKDFYVVSKRISERNSSGSHYTTQFSGCLEWAGKPSFWTTCKHPWEYQTLACNVFPCFFSLANNNSPLVTGFFPITWQHQISGWPLCFQIEGKSQYWYISVRESLCFESTHGPADILYTYLVFPGGLVQWSASRGVLCTDSLFHLQTGQVLSESGRGKHTKSICLVIKESRKNHWTVPEWYNQAKCWCVPYELLLLGHPSANTIVKWWGK